MMLRFNLRVFLDIILIWGTTLWKVSTEMTTGIVIRAVVFSGEWRAMEKGSGLEHTSESLRKPLTLHFSNSDVLSVLRKPSTETVPS